MHDRALMGDLVRKVEEIAREHGAARALSIRVRLGALSHLTPQHFLEHFESASRGGAAEGARVDVALSADLDAPEAQGVVLESVELPGGS